MMKYYDYLLLAAQITLVTDTKEPYSYFQGASQC